MSKKKIAWIATAVVVGLGAISSAVSDDGARDVEAAADVAETPTVDPAPEPTIPHDEVVATPTTPEPTEPVVLDAQTAAPIPPTPEIEGCTIAPGELVGQVEAGLGEGLELGLAYTTTDGPYTVLGASIYQTRDDLMGAADNRWSSADTWLIENGVVYALSGSANEYSEWPDGRDLPDNPSAGIGVPLDLQEQCTIPAITGR